MGVVISVMIIRSGIEMISETLDKVLGTRADRETTGRIKQLLTEEPEVGGAYDLIINNYGPDKNYASVHLELPDTMTVAQLDDLTRRVETKVYRETGVILAGVGAYSYNTGDNEAAGSRTTCANVCCRTTGLCKCMVSTSKRKRNTCGSTWSSVSTSTRKTGLPPCMTRSVRRIPITRS